MARDEGTFALSAAQIGLWLRHQLDPAGTAGTIAEYLDIRGPVDFGLWTGAFHTVMAETEACRVRIVPGADPPAQLIAAPPEAGPPLVDLSLKPSLTTAVAWMAADLAGPPTPGAARPASP